MLWVDVSPRGLDGTHIAAARPPPRGWPALHFQASGLCGTPPPPQPSDGLLGPASGLINMLQDPVRTVSSYFKAAAAELHTRVTQQSCFD